MLFLLFAFAHTLGMEEAEGRPIDVALGRINKMDGNWEFWMAMADKGSVLSKVVAKTAFGISNAEKARPRAPITIDVVGGDAGKSLAHMEGRFRSPDRNGAPKMSAQVERY